MSRILFAWELGANLGHLATIAPIGDRLRQEGHEVFVAARDTRVAAALLGRKEMPFTQAPVLCGGRRNLPPANYAELLLVEGYGDAVALGGAVRSWIALLSLFRADILVAEHAPTAVIAGQITGTPTVKIGTGFSVPPAVAPLPRIRPWEAVDEERLQKSEQIVMDSVNRVLRSLKASEAGNVADLFGSGPSVLCTYPEMDPFGTRDDARYVGPIYETQLGGKPVWPGDKGAKLFAYLRKSVPGVRNILEALRSSPTRTLCFIPGLSVHEAGRLASRNLNVVPTPVNLASALTEADATVSYAGHGTLCASLAAGVPLLSAPQNAEQYLHSRCLEALRAGTMLDGDRAVPRVKSALDELLSNSDFRENARAFAQRNRESNPERAVAAVAQSILQAA